MKILLIITGLAVFSYVGLPLANGYYGWDADCDWYTPGTDCVAR